MTTRQFYKSRITIEVLTEEPMEPYTDISTIAHEFLNRGYLMNSMYSMMTVAEVNTKINGKEVVRRLCKHGNDPDFFMLVKNGQDLA